MQVLRRNDRMLGVVEAARAGIVDRQAHQAAALEAAQHRVGHAVIQCGALVRDRLEHVGQAQCLGQREGVVQRTGVDAGDVDGTEAGHVDRFRFAAQLARVVLPQAQPALGFAFQRFADPLHRSDGGVVGHVHIGGGQQGAAVHVGARPAATGGEHRRGQGSSATGQEVTSCDHLRPPARVHQGRPAVIPLARPGRQCRRSRRNAPARSARR